MSSSVSQGVPLQGAKAPRTLVGWGGIGCGPGKVISIQRLGSECIRYPF